MINNMLVNTGKKVCQGYEGFRHFMVFSYEVMSNLVTFGKQSQTGFSVVVKQIFFTGFQAAYIIGFLAVAIGGLIILQGNILLSAFGQSRWAYVILVSVVIRELSSILTALIVVARSGTSICTELGNMVVNSEIDLLKSCGISPISYLVVSRTIGVVVAMFTLGIFFNIVSVFGGWFFTSLFYPIYFGDFINNFINEVMIQDIMVSVVKSVIFGFIIALVSCYNGLNVVKATTEVPQRTIKAVVNSIMLIIISNIIITYLYTLIF